MSAKFCSGRRRRLLCGAEWLWDITMLCLLRCVMGAAQDSVRCGFFPYKRASLGGGRFWHCLPPHSFAVAGTNRQVDMGMETELLVVVLPGRVIFHDSLHASLTRCHGDRIRGQTDDGAS